MCIRDRGIGAFLLDRVHGGHHQKGFRQLVGRGADGDLPFLHGLEQRALHFGGGPVDLVRKDEIAEDRPFFHREPVSYTHLRAHETVLDLVCRLLLEKKKHTQHDTALGTIQ